MGIPNKISPLTGGGDMLPRGYLPAEFLEITGYGRTTETPYPYPHFNIPLPVITTADDWEFSTVHAVNFSTGIAQAEGLNAPSGRLMCFYGGTAAKVFYGGYGISGQVKTSDFRIDSKAHVFSMNYTQSSVDAGFDEKKLTVGDGSTALPNFLGVFVAYAVSNYNSTNHYPFNGKKYSWRLSVNGTNIHNLIPALDPDGVPCMFDLVTRAPFKNNGTGQFIVGMTIPQARNLSNLPVTEAGALTVSLPWEAQWDAGVQNALSVASEKGWTITVQYRDPETIATYLPINFLESTGTQYIDAGLRYSTSDTYSETLDLSITDKNHMGHTGVNGLGWCTVQDGNYHMLDTGYTPIGERDIIYNKYLNMERFLYVNGVEVTKLTRSTTATDIIAGIFSLGNNDNKWFNTSLNIKAKLYFAKFTQNDVVARNMIPALDSAGIPCMLDLVTNQPFRNAGTGSFIAGFSTVEQSRQLATLPDVTAAPASLTVSLPWEAQWDAGVQAALQVAADKGWTLTVQYRDPEVATRNIPIGFLESTGEQLINTNVVPDSTIGFDMQIAYPIPFNEIVGYNPYFGVIGSDSYGNFRFAHSSKGDSNGNRPQERYTIETSHWFFYQYYNIKARKIYRLATSLTPLSETTPEVFLDGRQQANIPISTSAYVYTGPITTPIGLFGRIGFGEITNQGTPFIVQSANLKKNGKSAFNAVSVLDPTGTPCMYDKVSKQLFRNSGTGAFIAGFNTPEQSRQLAYLPDVTSETEAAKKSLTVSLPWEAQWDVITQAALQVATARGWTITVQYREPEITTTNMPISFLESNAASYIDTEVPLDANSSVSVSHYPSGVTERGCLFGARSDNDSLNFGHWNPAIHSWYNLYNKVNLIATSTPGKRRYWLTVNNGVFTSKYDNSTQQNSYESEFFECLTPCYLFTYSKSTGPDARTYLGRIYWFKLSNTQGVQCDFVPVIDTAGAPGMYDKKRQRTFYNIGEGQFVAGFDTIEQARSLAYLPDVTAETNAAKKSLTVSLPWEAQLVITYVPAALQVAADRGWTITVQYRDPEADNAYYNKYAHCNTVPSMIAVNPDYKTDLTADDEWIYPLPNMALVPEGSGKWWFRGSPLRKIHIEMPRLRQGQYLWRGSKLEDARVSLPSLTTDQRSMFEGCPLESVYLDAPNLTVAIALFAAVKTFEEVDDRLMNLGGLTNISYICFQMTNLKRFSYILTFVTTAHYSFASCPNFSVFEAEVPNLNVAEGMFRDCILNKESVLRVCNSIPTWTDGASHPITLGIHIDYQNDADVLTAIADAEAKGWTVTLQWNGTATAAAAAVSTFGLRSPSIYAKLGTMEYPDGTIKPSLDWGHYVTNWEENGYQEFSSIEEANEYFNINQTEEV